jgi:hypothetical protein
VLCVVPGDDAVDLLLKSGFSNETSFVIQLILFFTSVGKYRFGNALNGVGR